MGHAEDLKDKVQDGRVVLFVGAGMSHEAKLPKANELAEELAQNISYIPENNDVLGNIAEYYQYHKSRAELIDFLVNHLYKGAAPAPSHSLLPHLPWHLIYTTNYDFLIEKSYEAAKIQLPVVVYNAQMIDVPPNELYLVKLHGCLSAPYRRSSEAPIVITDEDYEIFGKNREAFLNQLRNFLYGGHSLLFVGYSLQDRFFLDLRYEVHSALQGNMPLCYAVLLGFKQERYEYWRRRHVILIDGTANSILQYLST